MYCEAGKNLIWFILQQMQNCPATFVLPFMSLSFTYLRKKKKMHQPWFSNSATCRRMREMKVFPDKVN